MRTRMLLETVVSLLVGLQSTACVKKSRVVAPGDGPMGFALTTSIAGALAILPAEPHATVPVRAAYFYDYMPVSHLDSLAAVGMNRAIIKWVGDSLGVRGTSELLRFLDRGTALGVEIVPCFNVQARERLAALHTARRYTWGKTSRVESEVGCPMDSGVWKSGLFDRADEMLAVSPGVRRLVVDLEIYHGSRHHYDAGPCRCPSCLREFAAARSHPGTEGLTPSLEEWQEQRLTRFFAECFSEFAERHPGVEVGFFDLDLDCLVHRAMARAVTEAGVPTADYTERTYYVGARTTPAARSALLALGVRAPLIGGLILKSFRPDDLPVAAKAMVASAEGYFIFTTYSLWVDRSKLSGGYALLGQPTDYWIALKTANH